MAHPTRSIRTPTRCFHHLTPSCHSHGKRLLTLRKLKTFFLLWHLQDHGIHFKSPDCANVINNLFERDFKTSRCQNNPLFRVFVARHLL